MTIDREDTLKKAEKFLRQGRLDLAIAEYERVVEDQPRDWNTANALGDLYLRGAQPERAAAVYQRIADHLLAEGFLPKAAAIYKKILKLTPDDERSQLQLAEISSRQGLLVDAKAYLTTVGAKRRARGDSAGADAITIKLGSLDASDYEGRLNAAAAIARAGDNAAAAARFREIHDDLVEKGRSADAVAALKESVRCEPSDVRGRALLAKYALERGALDEAREYLDRQTAGDDPALLLALVDVELRSGNIESGQTLLREILRLDAAVRDRVLALAWSLVESNIFAATACVDAAADAAIAQGQYADAAAILQAFATRVPGQVTALLKLVEVCVDGELEATMFEAQAQLADAYLATGRAAEARVIAEDLVAREPSEATHLHRFRRALELLQVPDIDAVIAERVNSSAAAPVEELNHDAVISEADMPAKSRGVPPLPEVEEIPIEEPPVMHPRAVVQEVAAQPIPPLPPRSAVAAPPPAQAAAPQSVAPPRPKEIRSMEIDLTGILGDLRPADRGAQSAAPSQVAPPQDLDRVFKGLRDRVAHEEAEDDPGEHMALARTYLEMGLTEEAVHPLETAARSPAYRFEAARHLARLARDSGDTTRSIDWLERAAEIPAPSVEEGHALLYDLGATLESAGESARALAVFLELQSDADNYRDVARRAAALSRSQTGG